MEENKTYKKRPTRKKPKNVISQKDKEVSDVEVARKILNIHQSALDRKLEFDLSFAETKKILETSVCFYTGIKFEIDGPNSRPFYWVDSTKGYINGNVVACTVDFNGKKSNLSLEEITILYLISHEQSSAFECKSRERYDELSGNTSIF